MSEPASQKIRSGVRQACAGFLRCTSLLLGVVFLLCAVGTPWIHTGATAGIAASTLTFSTNFFRVDWRNFHFRIDGPLCWFFCEYDRYDNVERYRAPPAVDWTATIYCERRPGSRLTVFWGDMPAQPIFAHFVPWLASGSRTFSEEYGTWGFLKPKRISDWYVSCPVWLICAILLWPIWFELVRFVRVRHRLRHNRCVTCGYDLRASPDRCPECGKSAAHD